MSSFLTCHLLFQLFKLDIFRLYADVGFLVLVIVLVIVIVIVIETVIKTKKLVVGSKQKLSSSKSWFCNGEVKSELDLTQPMPYPI